MPLKISCFNKTLYRKNLTRFWPLWGGVSLLGCIFPLFMLLSLLNGPRSLNPEDCQSILYIGVSQVVPLFLLFYTVLCGVLVWSYLNTSRSVGLYHTLPISRNGLFVTTVLSGLTMVLLPFVVVGGFFCLICLMAGGLDMTAVFWTVLMVCGMALFFFGASTFAAMIAGNNFAALAFYFVLNFLAVSLDWLISVFSKGFYFGVENYYTGNFEAFSPLVMIYRTLKVDYLNLGNGYTYCLQGRWIVAVYALVGVVLLLLSLLLYRIRKSESAGDVVALGFLKPVFAYGVALLSGLTLGQVLYEMLFTVPFGISEKRFFPMTVAVVVASLVGYYVASMLLKKTARVFKGDKLGPAVAVALAVLLCAGARLDVFGVEKLIPTAEETEYVYLDFADDSVEIAGDSPLFAQITDTHRMVLENKDAIRQRENSGEYSALRYFYIRYHLKDGSEIRREYRIPLSYDAYYNQPDSVDYKLRELMFSPEMNTALLHPASLRDWTLDNIYVNLWSESPVYPEMDMVVNGNDVAPLMEAMLADAAGGALIQDYIFEESAGANQIGSIEMCFQESPSRSEDGPRDSRIQYEYFNLNEDMKATIAYLEDYFARQNAA